jgi:hypothetical protein
VGIEGSERLECQRTPYIISDFEDRGDCIRTNVVDFRSRESSLTDREQENRHLRYRELDFKTIECIWK